MKNLKTDCVCVASKKTRIAGLSERPDGVSAVGSLSCPQIERANFRFVRQIARVNLASNGAQRWLDLQLGSTSLPTLQSCTNRFTGGNTREHFVLCKGCGFPAKRCGRQSPALPVTSQTRCLLSPKRRDFSLCTKDTGSILMLEISVFLRILDREKLEEYNEHKS